MHLTDVLSWFELPTATPFTKGVTFGQVRALPIVIKPGYLMTLVKKAAIPTSKYEALLKTNLECFKCQESFKTIPQLKLHLQKEWDEAKEDALQQKRRKTKDKTPEIDGS